ncbi:MAG TPA: hypothetical protein VK842_10280, partial [bacterium]|nr:hypothetical protein [bacterium]
MSKPRPLALALCLLGAALGHAAPAYPDLAAAVSAPAPEPAPPGDTFNPPISPGLAPDSCAPAIAEWTRSAGPGNSLVLTGSRLS